MTDSWLDEYTETLTKLYGADMANINQYYESNSKHLKAADIPPGKEVKVTIESIGEEKFDSGAKLTLKFAGKEKGLVLNKTNATAIGYVYGPDTDAWVGKDIFVFSTTVDFAGTPTPAIRVRVPMQETEEAIPGWD